MTRPAIYLEGYKELPRRVVVLYPNDAPAEYVDGVMKDTVARQECGCSLHWYRERLRSSWPFQPEAIAVYLDQGATPEMNSAMRAAFTMKIPVLFRWLDAPK